MKRLFYLGLFGLMVFEILNVYFIMPFPGSQRINSLNAAYFLYSYRWWFRIFFALLIAVGFMKAFSIRHKWIPGVLLLVSGFVVYVFNFVMTAEKIFRQPEHIVMKGMAENTVKRNSLVLGIERDGAARAYPIQFLIYHHQVQDTLGGKPVIATYCSVCRTGRAFEPVVNGQPEKFRLVGMDHFNAMFEDFATGSWWRQVNGECIAGELKGTRLPELEISQVTLEKWIEMHPHTTIMQPDQASLQEYDPSARFEQGKSEGSLTRTDSLSWKEKSWVLGIEIAGVSKAYDWNLLKGERIIHDGVGGIPIVLLLSGDGKSFAAFQRNDLRDNFTLKSDTIVAYGRPYDFSGRSLEDDSTRLKHVNVSQEFWHSWQTFHPATERYSPPGEG
ncbi:MAG TPA: DUF3179 domain-containing (seleno)protein [Bacteroidota bacterium]|nr:DUF3179 domain-containing (seleno)protein [Bacteroidota bacterium]